MHTTPSTTVEAFEIIMEQLCENIKNKDTDAKVSIKLTKRLCSIAVSSDVCLSNIDSSIFDITVKDKITVITFKK